MENTWLVQAQTIAAALKADACPDCGAPLFVDDEAETETEVWHRGTRNNGGMPYVEKQLRRCTVAFCTECEFAVEVQR